LILMLIPKGREVTQENSRTSDTDLDTWECSILLLEIQRFEYGSRCSCQGEVHSPLGDRPKRRRIMAMHARILNLLAYIYACLRPVYGSSCLLLYIHYADITSYYIILYCIVLYNMI
jgi:hypothetical protein